MAKKIRIENLSSEKALDREEMSKIKGGIILKGGPSSIAKELDQASPIKVDSSDDQGNEGSVGFGWDLAQNDKG